MNEGAVDDMDTTTRTQGSRVARQTRTEGAWRRRLPLLPALLFTILITQLPFVMSIWYSLTDWKIVPPTGRRFVWFENYTKLFSDRFFREAAITSVLMTASAVVISLVLGTVFAVLLDRKFF